MVESAYEAITAAGGRTGPGRAGTECERAESGGSVGAGQAGLVRRRQACESAARTYARALPVVPVRARGLTIEDADGHRYLDCSSGAGSLALGHNHPVVLEAIRAVLDSGAPLQVTGLTTPVEDAFVAELLRTLPPGLADHARVRFCGPGGTDPVATAVALVRAATGRARVVTPTDAEYAADPAVCCPVDAGEPPAGVLVEAVRGEAGPRPVPGTWLRGLRRVTEQRSVPLVADETETGVGRTGAFWAVEHSGVTPDVLVLSRAIGGSLPLAAVIHRAGLDDGRAAGAAAFRGNQLALAAGAATLAHVRAHRLAEHAAVVGGRILARLRGLAGEFACVGAVRGRGLMIGMELAAPDGGPGTGTAAELAAAVQRECLRRGLIVDLAGPAGNVVRLLPPLIVTEEQTSAVLDRLADAVHAVERRRGDHGPSPGARTAR